MEKESGTVLATVFLLNLLGVLCAVTPWRRGIDRKVYDGVYDTDDEMDTWNAATCSLGTVASTTATMTTKRIRRTADNPKGKAITFLDESFWMGVLLSQLPGQRFEKFKVVSKQMKQGFIDIGMEVGGATDDDLTNDEAHYIGMRHLTRRVRVRNGLAGRVVPRYARERPSKGQAPGIHGVNALVANFDATVGFIGNKTLHGVGFADIEKSVNRDGIHSALTDWMDIPIMVDDDLKADLRSAFKASYNDTEKVAKSLLDQSDWTAGGFIKMNLAWADAEGQIADFGSAETVHDADAGWDDYDPDES